MEPIKRNAGYEIVQIEEYDAFGREYTVLGHNDKTGMWVTWDCRAPDAFSAGHYFDNEWMAKMDYHKRLHDHYVFKYRVGLTV